VARGVAKGELWLSHPYNAQTLDGLLVASCTYRRAGYFPLKKLANHSKNPRCGCALACTGFAFLGVFVGDGIAVGEGVSVSVGVGGLVGIRVGILVGIFVGGVLLKMAFLYSISRWLDSGWLVSSTGAVYVLPVEPPDEPPPP
jgi:hypothetical protein